jgi:hypothetical protein
VKYQSSVEAVPSDAGRVECVECADCAGCAGCDADAGRDAAGEHGRVELSAEGASTEEAWYGPAWADAGVEADVAQVDGSRIAHTGLVVDVVGPCCGEH